MTMVVSPEVKNNFREDTLPQKPELTTADVIIVGEDLYSEQFTSFYSNPEDNPDFIGPRWVSPKDVEFFVGPHDATNVDRGLLESRIRTLAQVAAVNFPAYDGLRAKVVADVHASISQGTIRLGAEYGKTNVELQVEQFVSTVAAQAYTSREDVMNAIQKEKEQLRLGVKGTERDLQIQVNDLKKIIKLQGERILAVRESLVEGGASEEYLRDFDYTTKLMPKPEQEVYERERQLSPISEPVALVDPDKLHLFHSFKSVVASLSKFGLRSIGINAPQSAQLDIISSERQ